MKSLIIVGFVIYGWGRNKTLFVVSSENFEGNTYSLLHTFSGEIIGN